MLRVRKGGGVADVLAKGQASTIAIGVLGDHVYWGAANELRRTPRECVAPCTVDVVADVPNARHIAPAGPGALLVLAGNGTLYRYRADAPGIALVTSPSVGTNNFIATGAAENVAVGFTVDTIVVVPFDGAPTSRTIQPPRDAGDKGFPLVASDCNTYAGIGGTDPVLRAIGLDGTTTALQAMTGANDSPFGIAADEGVFYVGFANNGGLHMVDGNAKTGRKIAGGDVWRVTTDADGIYWGEHENGPKAGRLYRIRRK